MDCSIAAPLLNWYSQESRKLPWRAISDPYAIWVSEVMLQQTRVETVIPYYRAWMERFPNIQALASASQQDVLAAWEGLGYYQRALNLQRAAQIVMADYDGRLPADVKALRRLPGIGRYTAGAIASIAFGADEAASDGNIRRVLARVFNVEEPAQTPVGERRLWELASANLPAGRAAEYNQALMELGALVCTPRAPLCGRCPLAECCQARLLGVQEQRPVMKQKAQVPHVLVTAAVIALEDKVLITQRPLGGLLGGMWEFPGGTLKDGENLASCLQREIHEELGVMVEVGAQVGVFRHAYTHLRVTLHAFHCRLLDGWQPQPRPEEVNAMRWVALAELKDYPMGKIDRQISKTLIAERA